MKPQNLKKYDVFQALSFTAFYLKLRHSQKANFNQNFAKLFFITFSQNCKPLFLLHINIIFFYLMPFVFEVPVIDTCQIYDSDLNNDVFWLIIY